MGNHVSKPPLKPELNVLCIDGTKTTDSAMFAYQLAVAGKTMKNPADRVGIQNLLSLVGSAPNGTIAAPSKYTPTPGDPIGAVFPFGPAWLRTLPINKEPLPHSTQRIAEVLMPQGEVTGTTNKFSDPLLGPSDPIATAHRNSEMLKRLCLGPGISKVGTPDAHLDFASTSNVCTDILYLSGHGSMAATVCGEAAEPTSTDSGYIRYFELLLLLQPEFQALGPKLVSPMWMVVGACFGMRPAHAEIWLRYLNKLNVPMRGLLGYQMTAPLADTSAEVNRQFANELAKGSTFLKAWKTANDNTNNAPRWTAMVFDHAKDDTLTTLRDLKRGTGPTATPPLTLRFYDDSRSFPVQITPPPALIAFHQWGSIWNQMLVMNVDFTQAKLQDAADSSNGALVNNQSWSDIRSCDNSRWLSPNNLADMTWWNQQLCPERVYRILVFPPFKAEFQKGFQANDTIELSLVHVRQDYTHLTAAFLSVFDILQVNEINVVDGSLYGIPAPDPNLGKVQAATVRNRITFEHTSDRPAFEPLNITVRFRKEAAAVQYLWFWFAVKIVRKGSVVFPPTNFDNFILTLGSPHTCGGLPMPIALPSRTPPPPP